MLEKQSVLVVIGTRPEAIKMAPVIKALQAKPDNFVVKIVLTAQHRDLLDQVCGYFDIKSDYDLDLMKENQDLANLTARIVSAMDKIYAIAPASVLDSLFNNC